MTPRTTASPIIAIVGASGSGKTTLIEAMLPLLIEDGFEVGVLKHTHHDIPFDKSGKDSWRYAQRGASQVGLMTPSGVARFDYREPDAEPEAVAERLFPNVDLILVEGCKWRPVPKIEVYRCELTREPLCVGDPHLLAVATNDPVFGVRALSLDDPVGVARFIVEFVSESDRAEIAANLHELEPHLDQREKEVH
ncbi:MAG: molybdopterin-guanine dinucleotide biosynthesis protein B [Candidatus Poribacteria bacterium]|nr:molybdopterin-guanine dinucleotide biosynthesis protein B [Candidatus Poribacteria bacterium]